MTIVGYMQCYGWKLILPFSVLHYGLHPEERNTEGHTWHISAKIGNFNLLRAFDLRVAEIFQEKVKKQKCTFRRLNVTEDI